MIFCKYGCGQEGKYPLKCGGFCCSDNHNKCPENRRKNSETKKGEITLYRKSHLKETIEKIRKNPRLKNTRIAFLTVVKMSELKNKDDLKKLKVLDYIEKPFENDDLLKRVNKLVTSKTRIDNAQEILLV